MKKLDLTNESTQKLRDMADFAERIRNTLTCEADRLIVDDFVEEIGEEIAARLNQR